MKTSAKYLGQAVGP